MTDLPTYVLAFVVVLGVLVFFHELGHFLVARWCGVRVLRFSIGFGPVLWQRKLGADQTEWAFSLIPLGGYVKMLDEREGPVAADELPRAFNRLSVGRRSLIVAAGPLANFLLAILLYWGVFMQGSHELLPVLGPPVPGSPAALAGIENGEQVRRVGEDPVATWNDLRWMLLQQAASQARVNLEVINEAGNIAIRPLALSVIAEQSWEGEPFERLGLSLYRPSLPPVLGSLTSGGAAERAGLQSGDRILAIDGEAIAAWQQMVMRIRSSAGKLLHFEVERAGQVLRVDLTPDEVQEKGISLGRIGARVAEPPEGIRELRTFVRHDFWAAAGLAISETWDKSVFSLVMMGKMLTGEVSWKNLSGPVTIADYAGQSAKLGLDYYLKFMALVSISLGVLNLLPIPVLDGGHLMYHVFEVVRGRPLSERAMEITQRFGLSVILVLMTFAFFNDINRLVFG